ncbi:MAG: hypothetical protein COA78_29605 [Blastopirellula sp.]|nr:MAG: hypothetical protein COA78_29605 [Blastopirellula sp.]
MSFLLPNNTLAEHPMIDCFDEQGRSIFVYKTFNPRATSNANPEIETFDFSTVAMISCVLLNTSSALLLAWLPKSLSELAK